MNQENKLKQMASSAGEYLAPSVKVHEIKSRKVLCASETGNYPRFTNDDTPYGF